MDDTTSSLHDTLDAMSDSLSALESALDDVLSPASIEELEKSPLLVQAKQSVTMAYTVYDLVFVYLKLKGIDPSTHPVQNELGTVKAYFTKVQKAGEKEEKRTTRVDKEAADRFIRHAISQASAPTSSPTITGQESGISSLPPASTGTSRTHISLKRDDTMGEGFYYVEVWGEAASTGYHGEVVVGVNFDLGASVQVVVVASVPSYTSSYSISLGALLVLVLGRLHDPAPLLPLAPGFYRSTSTQTDPQAVSSVSPTTSAAHPYTLTERFWFRQDERTTFASTCSQLLLTKKEAGTVTEAWEKEEGRSVFGEDGETGKRFVANNTEGVEEGKGEAVEAPEEEGEL
ncbi:hypothetical protein BT69DRAFT_1340137 [Atractiella rhizophila]|nr:hypothetical protein BT69DRAFT_1340137 [Atractiella rhizophila]